ncbi:MULTISPECIES: gluconeogenesis factor YvcK family protein [Actinotignum]|uniref:Putative gluconeogenesis factor n=1 Tax=Actinotignum timonense TaxID=1870995 RepID=A0AAW9HKI9_9ACTO|nr:MULTISPECIES: uridine diphosphate-N-acetylglucosamine-binding protein YvcK [Actinotignum]MBS5749543.1 uridine diphosphate-N-acetylglucosamine-binding protein YvcK [Actinotignum schaalii]MDE1536430.1 uridine diphosphate-N-acetylglucosamine-binding protein YvcK [Actinotignum schaalii]MDE1558463.1 uridine diphosphate-N-acetylglucosamine-binding protein YvcK [Actinotignum schaalii]MDE1663025.1 uridine diphosphate-N-acetylglucosamine-binding protein YvcK [Actinotignum schaalii]MDK6373432.1 uridi
MGGRGSRGPRVVALGGGHGLYASLSALRLITQNITAVVTVADDGGSSGRLRDEFNVIPPGDLRMALSALCDDGEWGQTWRDVLQYRFSSEGPLNGHAMGNLLIVSMWEQLGSTVSGLDWVGQLLRIDGRVLPMSPIPLEIEARVIDEEDGPQLYRGQVAVATARGKVEHVSLIPENPPAQPEAIAAIDEADWIVFGPGSWYTSVIPHLMVPDLHAALVRSPARRVLALNLRTERETWGMSAADHIRSFARHAPDLRIDVVVADPRSVDDIGEVAAEAEGIGATLMLRQVRMGDNRARHDALRLAAAYRDAFEGVIGDS